MTTKNTTQHTPGPWEVDGHEVFAAGDYFVARIERNQYTPHTDKRKAVTSANYSMSPQDKANAALIAAAPCMLSALQLFVRSREDGGVSMADLSAAAYDKARAAIARATGDTD